MPRVAVGRCLAEYCSLDATGLRSRVNVSRHGLRLGFARLRATTKSTANQAPATAASTAKPNATAAMMTISFDIAGTFRLTFPLERAANGSSGAGCGSSHGHERIAIHARSPDASHQCHIDLAPRIESATAALGLRDKHAHTAHPLAEPTQRETDPSKHVGSQLLRHHVVAFSNVDLHLDHGVLD
jgi:hypothetical protein